MDAAAILDVDRALRVATRAVQRRRNSAGVASAAVEVLCEEAHDIKLKADQLAGAYSDVLRGSCRCRF